MGAASVDIFATLGDNWSEKRNRTEKFKFKRSLRWIRRASMPVSESRNLSAEAPMIYKGKRNNCKKMGSAFSKQKQKKEGLMSQMKSKTKERSTTPSRTPVSQSPSFCQTPPPRNLATTISSPQLSQEFLSFLSTLDKASGLEEDECGLADSF